MIILIIFIVTFTYKTEIFKSVRSPFLFVEQLYNSKNKNYWDLFKLPGQLTGVEIGVRNGKNAKKILSFMNIKTLYLVDPWKEYQDGHNYIDQKYQDNAYREVTSLFKKNENVKIIRESSFDAANKFDDNFFDFIYIDGNHDYIEVLKDLRSWYPKLKKFGVMCGDDYGHPSGFGVIEAVNEFAFENKVFIKTTTDNQFWFVKTK